jgi:hypothetical protein
MPQTVLANRIQSRDAKKSKLIGAPVFRNLDGSQVTGFEKHATV